MIVRQAQLEDAPALARIIRDSGWFSSLENETPEKTAQKIRRQLRYGLSSDNHSFYVAVVDEQSVAAYAAVHWLPYLFLPAPEAYLSELFVATAYRGQNIGSHLLKTIVDEASRRGCIRLMLFNDRQRASYQRGFYRKHGWIERAEMANFVLMLAP